VSEANKAQCMRIYDELFNEGRLEVVDEVIAADAVDHSPPPDSTGDVREDLRNFARLMRTAFPDAVFTVRQMIAEGGLAAAYCTFEGTHDGDFMGIPATGRRVSMDFMDFIRVVDGQCTEHWGVGDVGALMQQIGSPPSA
jgi:steroid delta-isomerase-like uncharacterized protein